MKKSQIYAPQWSTKFNKSVFQGFPICARSSSSLQTDRRTSYRDAKKIRKEHTSAWNFDSFSTPNSTTFIMPIIFLSSIKGKLKQGIHKKFQDHQRFNLMIFFNKLLWIYYPIAIHKNWNYTRIGKNQ